MQIIKLFRNICFQYVVRTATFGNEEEMKVTKAEALWTTGGLSRLLTYIRGERCETVLSPPQRFVNEPQQTAR